MNTCPKCKTGIIADASHSYGTKANKCYSCGAYHTVGSSRESIDRQITGQEPRGVLARKQAAIN